MLENIELNKNNNEDKSIKTDKTDKMNRMNVKDYLKPNLRSITRNVKTTTKNVKRAAKKFDTSSKITEYFGQEPSRDKKKRVSFKHSNIFKEPLLKIRTSGDRESKNYRESGTITQPSKGIKKGGLYDWLGETRCSKPANKK